MVGVESLRNRSYDSRDTKRVETVETNSDKGNIVRYCFGLANSSLEIKLVFFDDSLVDILTRSSTSIVIRIAGKGTGKLEEPLHRFADTDRDRYRRRI